jgi:DNA-binding response OmpR family regulator
MSARTVVVVVDSAEAATDIAAKLQMAGCDNAVIVDARASATVYRHAGLEVHFDARKVCLHGQEIALTSHEFAIIAYLARHAGKVRSIAEIFEAVWQRPFCGEAAYLWTYARRLRHKLETDPHRPVYVLARAGHGYCMPPCESQGVPAIDSINPDEMSG